MGKNRHPHIGIHLEAVLIEKMNTIQKKLGITRTEVVKRAIRLYLSQNGLI
jgi:metal-responsive CopG/Arc/MetJ family transcriptional regulator